MQEKEIFLKLKFDDLGNIIEVSNITDKIKQQLEKKKEEMYIENEFLTNEDVAKILKCSTKSVIEKRSKGVFPVWTYTKISGVGYRFKKKELLEFLGLDEK